MTEICSFFSQLPLDVINDIVSYYGVIRERNGKYMKQIPRNDPRYYLLRTIPRSAFRQYNTRWVMCVDFYNNRTLDHFRWPSTLRVEYDKLYNEISYWYNHLLHTKYPNGYIWHKYNPLCDGSTLESQPMLTAEFNKILLT